MENFLHLFTRHVCGLSHETLWTFQFWWVVSQADSKIVTDIESGGRRSLSVKLMDWD